MNKSVKYFLGLWIILLIGVSGLLYSTYSKLKPQMFIDLLSEQIQRNYPGATVEVGKVNYRLSVDFKMGLKDVLIKRSDKIIGSLQEVELRLPLWLLLFQHGNAQINLNKLVIFIEDASDTKASKVTSPISETVGKVKVPSHLNLTGPDYLGDVKFTLRAKEVTVVDLKNSRRLALSKLLVREFQFGKNSAFELNLPVSISHKEISYNSELWLFGDLTPRKKEWSLNFRGEFRTSDSGEKFQLEDLIIDGKARFQPHKLDITSNLTFFIEKKKVGTGTFAANDKELNVDFKFSSFPLSFLGLFKDELKNPHLPLLTGRAEGLLQIKKRYSEEIIKLRGSLHFPGSFKLGPESDTDNDVPGKWRINFADAKWETSFISPKGEVSFFRRSVIDFEQGKVSQYIEELGFSEIDFSRPVQLLLPLHKVMTANADDYSSTTVSFKKCKLGDKDVNGVFVYGISPDKRFYSGEIKDGTSSMKIHFHQSNFQKKLDLVFSKFTWIKEYSFLKPFFSASTGELEGKLEGRWEDEWTSGHWLSMIKGTSLTDAAGEWIKFIDGFWKTFGIKSVSMPDQGWNIRLKNSLIFLEPLLIEGVDPIKMSGKIDLNLKNKSFLVLKYPKNRKWKPVTKEISEAFWKKEEL